MRDHEQEYPKHQPGRGEHSHHDPFAPDTQEEGELEERPRRGPLHQRDAATTPQLPPGHARKALTVGAISGAFVSLQGVILTLVNSSTYKGAAAYIDHPDKMPVSIASSLFGIFVLGLFISALIYLICGMIIGKVAVHRRWAFIGGFVGGVISSLIGAVLKQIPAYPNAGNSGFSGGMLGIGGSFVALLIGIVILSVLAGAVTLLGSWVTTRRHPYYVGYAG